MLSTVIHYGGQCGQNDMHVPHERAPIHIVHIKPLLDGQHLLHIGCLRVCRAAQNAVFVFKLNGCPVSDVPGRTDSTLLRTSAGYWFMYLGTSGRGPTKLMRPSHTSINCGSSSEFPFTQQCTRTRDTSVFTHGDLQPLALCTHSHGPKLVNAKQLAAAPNSLSLKKQAQLSPA